MGILDLWANRFPLSSKTHNGRPNTQMLDRHLNKMERGRKSMEAKALVFTSILPIVLFILCCFPAGVFSQRDLRRSAVDVRSTLDPNRVRIGHYRLVFFQQNEKAISNIGILDREIAREPYHGKPAIKITEITNQDGSLHTTSVFIDDRTLKPFFLESRDVKSGDAQRVVFERGHAVSTDVKGGVEKKVNINLPDDVFVSTCFSELVQANDFARHALVTFTTVNPGNTPNKYVAERAGEKRIELPSGMYVNCWLIRFTKIGEDGQTSSAGFRFIDKRSGKVLMFKFAMNSPNYFTYQILSSADAL